MRLTCVGCVFWVRERTLSGPTWLSEDQSTLFVGKRASMARSAGNVDVADGDFEVSIMRALICMYIYIYICDGGAGDVDVDDGTIFISLRTL